MKILLLGRSGQVGAALAPLLRRFGPVFAPTHAEVDLARPDSVRDAVRACSPSLIVNAAAYTAVDRAESEPELARAVNAEALGVLAREASRYDALLVHYSTDYVFDGTKSAPYVEDDAPAPLGVYGQTKLAGEQAVLASDCRHLIFRTSWVYAATGRNFLLTMLRLAREQPRLRVVEDQRGAPTSARAIARGTVQALDYALGDSGLDGVYHMTAGGQTSWHGFACAILARAGLDTPVDPIPTSAYPTPARRPLNSLLDNARLAARFGVRLPDWEVGLDETLKELAAASAAT